MSRNRLKFNTSTFGVNQITLFTVELQWVLQLDEQQEQEEGGGEEGGGGGREGGEEGVEEEGGGEGEGGDGWWGRGYNNLMWWSKSGKKWTFDEAILRIQFSKCFVTHQNIINSSNNIFCFQYL